MLMLSLMMLPMLTFSRILPLMEFHPLTIHQTMKNVTLVLMLEKDLKFNLTELNTSPISSGLLPQTTSEMPHSRAQLMETHTLKFQRSTVWFIQVGTQLKSKVHHPMCTDI